jgi:4-carboxymuconolactone decarboxylase
LTELGILVAARELDSQFEWSAHEPVALKEGLEPAIIDVVRFRKSAQGLGEKEALIINLGRELFRKHKVSRATFAHAQKVFGDRGVVDLAALMGDYTSINMLINTFDIQLQPDQKPLLPMP